MQKILVVDDHDDIREMMRLTIENFGYEVIEAAGAYEAIDKADEFHPDLILMDIGMPLLDGLSATRMIKDLEKSRQIPVVLVTAYSDMRSQAAKAGCSDVIYKPVDFDRLKKVLNDHLGM